MADDRRSGQTSVAITTLGGSLVSVVAWLAGPTIVRLRGEPIPPEVVAAFTTLVIAALGWWLPSRLRRRLVTGGDP